MAKQERYVGPSSDEDVNDQDKRPVRKSYIDDQGAIVVNTDLTSLPVFHQGDLADSSPSQTVSQQDIQSSAHFYQSDDSANYTALHKMFADGTAYSGPLISLSRAYSGFLDLFSNGFLSGALSSTSTDRGQSESLYDTDFLSQDSYSYLYGVSHNSYGFLPRAVSTLTAGGDAGGQGGGSSPVPDPVDLRDIDGRYGTAKSYGWYVLNNGYNETGYVYGVDYTINTTYNAYNLTDGTTFNWSYPQNQLAWDAIRAYPSVAFGSAPFSGDGYDPAHVFPIQVSNLREMDMVYDISIGGETNGFNVSYDIWFTDAPGGTNVTTELMIWLHQGGVDTYGSPVGVYSDGVHTGTIYHTGTYTALVLDQEHSAGTIDLVDVIQTLIGLGIMSSSEYLGSSYFGAEVVEGAGSLTINDLEYRITVDGGGGSDVSYVVTGAGVEGYLDVTDVFGTNQGDAIVADIRDNIMYGYDGNDTLSGGEGNDVIYGGNGDDVLFGNDGNDILIGGAGNDTLFGNAGADIFVLDVLTNSIDWIIDFNVSEGDRLDLSLLLSNYDPLTDAITDFVRITENSGSSSFFVDENGNGNNWTIVGGANSTGLTDVQALVNAGTLIVSA